MVAVTYGVARVAAPKNAGGRASSPRPNIATRFVTALMEARLKQEAESPPAPEAPKDQQTPP